MKGKLKRSILLVLNAWELPMDAASLNEAVRAHAGPERPTVSDIEEALRECETEGYVQGVTDDFTKAQSWTLTQKGEHQARKLR
jgi:hypothetical protein